MAADGRHTVGEFVRHKGWQYDGGTPPGLREQIHGIINELAAEGILRLHDEPKPLPPYFAEEHFAQPPEVRKAQMEADGLIGGGPFLPPAGSQQDHVRSVHDFTGDGHPRT
jgi:hypothetical protein